MPETRTGGDAPRVQCAEERTPRPGDGGSAARHRWTSISAPTTLELPAGPPHAFAGDPHDVEEAAKLLIDAACPMILAGQGVLYAEAIGGTGASWRNCCRRR